LQVAPLRGNKTGVIMARRIQIAATSNRRRGGAAAASSASELIAEYGYGWWRTDETDYLWEETARSSHPSDTDPVAVIDDRMNWDIGSGGDNNMVIRATGREGIYDADGINSQGSVKGNDVDSTLWTTSLGIVKPYYILYVFNGNDDTTSRSSILGGPTDNYYGTSVNSWKLGYIVADVNKQRVDNTQAEFMADNYVKVIFPTTGDQTFEMTGASWSYSDTGGGTQTAISEMGVFDRINYDDRPNSYYIGELVLLDIDIPSADLETIEADVKDRWGF
jgi:hypothetical protein